MNEATESKIPCCPPLEADKVCDVLDFHYRLKHNTDVVSGGRRVQVEVIIHARFERCPGPMTLGDLSYSTTLLPGAGMNRYSRIGLALDRGVPRARGDEPVYCLTVPTGA